MGNGELPAENDQPDDIEDKPAGSEIAKLDLFAERPKDKARDLETLQPKRDTDDGDAQNQPGKGPSDKREDPADEQPDEVADNVHGDPQVIGAYSAVAKP